MNITDSNLVAVSGAKAGQRAIFKNGKAILVGIGGSVPGTSLKAGIVVKDEQGQLMVQPLTYVDGEPVYDGQPQYVNTFYVLKTQGSNS